MAEGAGEGVTALVVSACVERKLNGSRRDAKTVFLVLVFIGEG